MARAAAIANGLPLNVPTCWYSPLATSSITLLPPMADVESPPPIALATQTRSEVTPSSPEAPPGPTVKPVFTSSKVSSAPWAWRRSLSDCEVAVVGDDDPGVHHDRLEDHARDLAGVARQRGLDGGQVVGGDDHGAVHGRLEEPGVLRDADRGIGRAEVADALGLHRDHHGVVVAVVAALELDDPLTAGGGAHQVDGVHRRLGAGVAEAPQRLAVALGQVVGDDDGVLGRLGEVGALADPLADRRDDRRVVVAGQRDAVPAVEVGVLVAVDVVQLRAVAVAQPDGVRLGDLPAGRRAAGQRGGPSRTSPRCAAGAAGRSRSRPR